MENNIIYAVCNRGWRFGKIEEYKILKETEKTYIVVENGVNQRYPENRVRKDIMGISDLHFCLTYEEALRYKIDLCEKMIINRGKEIEEAKKSIEKAIETKNATAAELEELKRGGAADNG